MGVMQSGLYRIIWKGEFRLRKGIGRGNCPGLNYSLV